MEWAKTSVIPKTFTLINRSWNVELLDKEIAQAGEMSGDCSSHKALIRVAADEDREYMEHTYLHELVHALLEASSRPSLSKKEAFVDSLAAVLHQYLKTKKGKLEL